MMKKRILAMIMATAVLFSAVVPEMEANAAEERSTQTGTTYYVSTLHGKDSNDGRSERTPFYSLRKINHLKLQPGDQILLECGSVFKNGYLHLYGQSGSEEAPIIIDQYGKGADPIIDTNGQGVWYQNYGHRLDNTNHKYQGYVSSSILLYDTEYIEIKNLEIVNKAPKIDTAYNATDKIDQTGVAAVAQDGGTIDHIYLNNLNIHDVMGNVRDKHMNNGGIYFTVFAPHDEVNTVTSTDNSYVRTIDQEGKNGISRYNDVRIENCSVINTNRWGIAVGYTEYWDKFQGSVISEDVIKKYGSSNVLIQNNYVKDAGSDSITMMYCDRPLVQYNVSDGGGRQMHTGDYNFSDGQRFSAGIWPWKCKDGIFQYNEAFDTKNINDENGDGQAWDADWTDGTIYQYNYSHHNGGGCLMVCLQEAYRTTFRYNISQDDLKSVICLFGNPRAHIYNNIFYYSGDVPLYRAESKGAGPGVLENNIFYYAGDTPKTEDWRDSNKTYNNNLYYNYANTPTDANGVVVEKGTEVFKAAGSAPVLTTGIVNLHEDPAVRSVFDGYKLVENSPAIGAGKVITDLNDYSLCEKDFFGNDLKDVTTFDIGVHQYQENEDESEMLPAAPQKVEAGETTDTSATISWPAVIDSVGIEGYKIMDGDTVLLDLTGEALEAALDEETQMISVQIQDLEPGKQYSLSVAAYDTNNCQSAAQSVSFKTAQDAAYIEVEDKLQEIVSSAWEKLREEENINQSSASWQALIKAYEDALKISSGDSKETLEDAIAAIKLALDNVKLEEVENPPKQEVTTAEKLAAPALAQANAVAAKDGVKIQLAWNAVANAASYTLQRTVDGSVTAIEGITDTSYSDTTLYGGKEVSYSVIAVSGNKEKYTDSDAGEAKTVKLEKAPKKFKVKKSGKKAALSWKKVKGVKKYLIFRSDKKDGVYKKVGTAKKNKTSYIDKKVKVKKTYYYKIAATVKGNVTAMTTAKKIKIK